MSTQYIKFIHYISSLPPIIIVDKDNGNVIILDIKNNSLLKRRKEALLRKEANLRKEALLHRVNH
jgi:hypothetical protein